MKGLTTCRVHEILRGVYPEHKMRFFASLRMTGEGLRMTGEGFRMTNEGLRMTFSVFSVIRNRKSLTLQSQIYCNSLYDRIIDDCFLKKKPFEQGVIADSIYKPGGAV